MTTMYNLGSHKHMSKQGLIIIIIHRGIREGTNDRQKENIEKDKKIYQKKARICYIAIIVKAEHAESMSPYNLTGK